MILLNWRGLGGGKVGGGKESVEEESNAD